MDCRYICDNFINFSTIQYEAIDLQSLSIRFEDRVDPNSFIPPDLDFVDSPETKNKNGKKNSASESNDQEEFDRFLRLLPELESYAEQVANSNKGFKPFLNLKKGMNVFTDDINKSYIPDH